LALLVLAKGSVPRLRFADREPAPRTGERIFVVSGLGGAGGAITQGFVADVSGAGLQHDAAVGQAFQGGPVISSDGAVLAIASRAYAPLGFTSDGAYFAPLVRAACEKVLKCPGGGDLGRGDKR
ncbi:MAG: S1C family serine protease, partial [Acidimicrobiales bacterium]